MKKQRLFASNLNLKIEGNAQKTAAPETQVINDLDEHLKASESDHDDFEGIDTSVLQEVMKDDEKFVDMLINTNDKAVQELQGGNSKESLNMLEKLEKLLEYAAINKKILDRNLVIICLYNLACNHQALWSLEKCSKYVDGVLFNLNQSLKQDEALLKEPGHKLDNNQKSAIRAIKLRKLQFLVKVYLQHCAVLSQLSKHDEALSYAKKCMKLVISVFIECADCCKEAQKKIEAPSAQTNHDDSRSSEFGLKSSKIFDSKRIIDDQNAIFRDEVSYLKNILEYASPFIQDVIENSGSFSNGKEQDLLKQTRKSLFNWKNNPENNEKYLRKEFGSKLPDELKDANRSLLGVQRPTEWLESLNIGSMMHMKPMKYKEYAQKKEFTNEITKDALQEKIIYQSLIYFTIATEMRFLDMTDGNNGEQADKTTQEELRNKERYKTSEIYHLKSIEVACRYVNKPCPYINHLISSYQKHYNQDLETIPEESYYTASEGATTHEVSREYEKKSNFSPFDQVDEVIIKKKIPPNKSDSITEKNKPDLTTSVKVKDSPTRINKKNLSDQLKEDKVSVIHQIKQRDLEKLLIKKDSEEIKKKKEIQTENDGKVKKSPAVKPKKKLGEDDEAKNVFISSLTSRSLGLDTLLSHNLSPMKLRTVNPTPIKEVSKQQVKPEKEDKRSSPKYFVKKNFDIPSFQAEKIIERGMRTQGSPERSSSEKVPGFMSERSIHKDMYHKRPESGNNAQKMITEPNDSSVNTFLYKNFNKFIQNVYVDEQTTKKVRPEAKKESKLVNNPYSKEIAASQIIKKSAQSKRSTASQSTKTRQNQSIGQNTSRNISQSFGKPSYKEVELKRGAELSPRANKDFIISTDEKDLKSKIVTKFAKSVSLKTIGTLDLKKTKSERDQFKMVSPRD